MLYLDTSAAVKLVRLEAESTVLREAIDEQPLLSSEVTVTELHRAIGRYPDEQAHVRADGLLTSMALIALRHPLLRSAGRLGPAPLRSLDALHVVSALVFAEDLTALVTYDVRMAAAARQHGLEVWSPGASA